jgi:hypothetical protein
MSTSAEASLEESQKALKVKDGISALFMLRCDRIGHAGPVRTR